MPDDEKPKPKREPIPMVPVDSAVYLDRPDPEYGDDPEPLKSKDD